MMGRKKYRASPPWWVRAPLYAALWPRPELSEYRVRLERKYQRELRSNGRSLAKKACRRDALRWTVAAGFRIIEKVGGIILQFVR